MSRTVETFYYLKQFIIYILLYVFDDKGRLKLIIKPVKGNYQTF